MTALERAVFDRWKDGSVRAQTIADELGRSLQSIRAALERMRRRGELGSRRDMGARIDVARLHAQGLTTREIAIRLDKLEPYIRQVLRALGLIPHVNERHMREKDFPVYRSCSKCGLRGEHVCTLPVWAVASHRPGPGYLG